MFGVVARVGAAFLNLWQNPEWVDPTEDMDPEYEPLVGEVEFFQTLASHMPEGVWHRYSVELLKAPNGDVFCDDAALLPMNPGAATPRAASVPPGAVEVPAPAPGFNLPMFKASDLEAIAAECIDDICRNPVPLGSTKWSQYVAEIVVSAITYELHGLAFDQSRRAVLDAMAADEGPDAMDPKFNEFPQK